MLSEAAAVCERHRPLLAACVPARYADPDIDAVLRRELEGVVEKIVMSTTIEMDAGTSRPVSPHLTELVHILAASTVLLVTGDTYFTGSQPHSAQVWQALTQLWTTALWGPEGIDRHETAENIAKHDGNGSSQT